MGAWGLVVTALVIVSAFFHALWNALVKREPDKAVTTVAVVGTATAIAAVVAVGQGLWLGQWPFASPRAVLWCLGAGTFEAGYLWTLALALTRAPLGVAYTVSRGVALLCVWPLSVLLLGERATALGLVGAGVLTVGLLLTGLDRLRLDRGASIAVLCGAFIAAYHLGYKQAMAIERSEAAVVTLTLGIAVALNVAWLGTARRQALAVAFRVRGGRILVAGTFCALGFLLALGALRAGGAAAVLTLRNTSIVFAALFGWIGGEALGWRRVGGIVLVALGAVLLGWT